MVILNGVIYDYCEDIRFYSVLGVIDSEDEILRGIEIISPYSISAEQLKEVLKKGKNIRLVCGTMSENITYYAMDLLKGEIAQTKLKAYGENYEGNENTLCAKTSMNARDSKFKSMSFCQNVEDAELEALLFQTLQINKSNAVWNGIQSAIMLTQTSPKVKVLEA